MAETEAQKPADEPRPQRLVLDPKPSDPFADQGDPTAGLPDELSEQDVEKMFGLETDRMEVAVRDAEGEVHTKKLGDAKREFKGRHEAARAAAKKAAEAEAEGSTEAEPEAAPAAEAEKPEAEAAEAASAGGEEKGEEKADAEAEEKPEEKKAGETRRQKKKERYRQKNAEAARMRVENEALRAEVAALKNRRPPDDPTDYSTMPKPDAFDDDESYQEAVKKWTQDQIGQYRFQREKEAVAREEKSSAERDQAVFRDLQGRCRESVFGRGEGAEAAATAVLNRVVSPFAGPREPGKPWDAHPVTTRMTRYRDDLERRGLAPADGRTAPEVYADFVHDPETFQWMESATANTALIDAMASLDNPYAVAKHLRQSSEGKAAVEDLERLASASPARAALRLAQIEARVRLNGGAPEAPRESVEPEVSNAPAPGGSPAARSRNPAPSPAPKGAPGSYDQAAVSEFEKTMWH